MKFSAVILSGGASRRMGTPKALLPLSGETFLDRLIGLFQPYCTEVIVVLGHHAELIRAGAQRTALFTFNPDHALGQLTSLQCGLRAVDASSDGVLFTPVDYPVIQPSTVESMLAAFDRTTLVVAPRHNNRHGHPVLISSELIPQFLQLTPEQSARDVIHAAAGQTRYVDVEDPGILRDIDDVRAYQELTA